MTSNSSSVSRAGLFKISLGILDLPRVENNSGYILRPKVVGIESGKIYDLGKDMKCNNPFKRFPLQSNANKMHKDYLGKLASQNNFVHSVFAA